MKKSIHFRLIIYLISLTQAKKVFSHHQIIADVSFSLNDNLKIIGHNLIAYFIIFFCIF